MRYVLKCSKYPPMHADTTRGMVDDLHPMIVDIMLLDPVWPQTPTGPFWDANLSQPAALAAALTEALGEPVKAFDENGNALTLPPLDDNYPEGTVF